MSKAKKDEQPKRKKRYKKPSLIHYGLVRDLTAGGSGHAHEGSSGKKPRP